MSATSQLSKKAPSGGSGGGFNPLSVQLKYLNPENEMKRKFGQKVVSSNDSSRQVHICLWR